MLRGVFGLALLILLSACVHAPVAESVPPPSPVGVYASAAQDRSQPLSHRAGAVSREGNAGHQRSTVPPDFLWLMLGVPLLILLL